MNTIRGPSMKVESICIVGGGSSGWMTAAMLSHCFPDLDIALVESPDVKPIGVGESTLGHFNRFLIRLGLHNKDKEWMPYCNATYKTSIAFKNFREGKGERFHYPFGEWNLNDSYCDNPIRFYELALKYPDLYPPEEFARFANKSTWLAENNKYADSIPGTEWNPMLDVSYHLDAELFGNYLRDKIAIPNGVVHIKANIENVVRKPDGYIESVMTDSGGVIGTDLYIDCTGFKSLLLEQHMGVEFVSFKDKLFNDTALATKIDYRDIENEMESYTDCVAMDAGWVWNIPLWHRIGTGYVYCSDYINECEAEVEFRKYLSARFCPACADRAEMKKINIKHGKHKEAWVKNVIGIGLSYGFVEPLESTGLMTTHENVLYLVDILERRNGITKQFDRDSFNRQCNNTIESMANFVSMHYTLSSRDDNQYWRDVTENISYATMVDDKAIPTCEELSGALDLMQSVENTFAKLHEQQAGAVYVAAGQGYRPFGLSSFNEKKNAGFHQGDWNAENMHEEYQRDRVAIEEWTERQLTHYEYLKRNIYV